MKELIKCNNISLSYDGVDVLKDISFSIYDDDYLCIVGENGSGKYSYKMSAWHKKSGQR